MTVDGCVYMYSSDSVSVCILKKKVRVEAQLLAKIYQAPTLNTRFMDFETHLSYFEVVFKE